MSLRGNEMVSPRRHAVLVYLNIGGLYAAADATSNRPTLSLNFAFVGAASVDAAAACDGDCCSFFFLFFLLCAWPTQADVVPGSVGTD